jgi:hypothetical protein
LSHLRPDIHDTYLVLTSLVQMQHSDASANHDTLTTDKIPEHKFKSSSLQGVKPATYQHITQEQKNISETRTPVLHLHTPVESPVLHLHTRSQFVRSPLNVELTGYMGTCYLPVGLDSRLQVSSAGTQATLVRVVQVPGAATRITQNKFG